MTRNEDLKIKITGIIKNLLLKTGTETQEAKEQIAELERITKESRIGFYAEPDLIKFYEDEDVIDLVYCDDAIRTVSLQDFEDAAWEDEKIRLAMANAREQELIGLEEPGYWMSPEDAEELDAIKDGTWTPDMQDRPRTSYKPVYLDNNTEIYYYNGEPCLRYVD